MRNPDNRTKRHENGFLAVDQGREGPFVLSYNPDDNRFYVHLDDEDKTTVATFVHRRNAVYFARKRSLP